ncbi:MAG: family 20 glycosylhydrolase, partial [Oscillospiraceae bacterium]|nr:family 20 glycosylhydrolase [Oscillospiraceae bacterium]
MFTGNLLEKTTPVFRRLGTSLLLPADKGSFGWNWNTLMDTGVDIVCTFDEISYISEVSLTLGETSGVKMAEVFCDGICCGRYSAETGKIVSGSMDIPVGISVSEVMLRLHADLKDIVIEDLCIYGVQGEEPILFPTPDKAVYSGEAVTLADLGAVTGEGEDAAFAAAHLRSRIAEHYDLPFDGPVSVRVEYAAGIPAEGFSLTVSESGILVKASGRRGMLYGCEALFQLFEEDSVPVCEITDAPYKELRGFHVGLPPRCELDFAKRFFKYVLLPMRYNTIFLEFAGGMRFDSHPEISEAWEKANAAAKRGELPPFPHGDMVSGGGLLEQDEVRDLVDYARTLGFEVIPEVQSFGHVQYITYAHPDIAEVTEEEKDVILDTRAADQPPSTFYKHSYCPMNEKSYEIIFDLIDEIVEVVRPERYVHMGHDEIYQIGLCPRCKNIPHDELYARHVIRMYDYLKARGYKMAIWSDMLQPTEKRYQTCTAIDRLPKDILMLDFIWYFHFDMDLENNILPAGFPVAIGNLYSSHFPRAEKRLANVIGGEVS